MARFVKLILFIILTTAFLGSVCGEFTVKSVDTTTLASRSALENDKDAQMNADCQGSFIPTPQLPYLSDAEIAVSSGTTQLLTFSRAQRSYTTEYILLKDVLERMARLDDVLSLHRSKLFDTNASNRCHPACEYYVFTLRRIII